MPLNNRRSTTRPAHKVGDKVYGAPGGSRRSMSFVLSYRVADRIAATAGLDREAAHRFLIAFGKTALEMLMAGQPIGIPHVGVLHLSEKTRRVSTAGLREHARRNGFLRSPSPKEGEVVRVRTPTLTVSENMRGYINDNARKTGSLRSHMRAAYEHLRRRLRHHKNHRADALRHTQEGPIMETNENAPKAKPGMLVEDADAAVVTTPQGRQEVLKTPDRAAEAARQGKDESAL